MSQTTGYVRKMKVTHDLPVRYQMVLDEHLIDLNPLIGHPIEIRHTGSIVCINCERRTQKSFSQGYCYPCFSRLAECDQCIMSPEKCHYHLGTCRDPEWGRTHCMQPHYVYLANSSGIKVGITRATQLPTRWIDQGAVAGLVVAEVSSRMISGLVEAAVRQFVSDRTSWQKMLKGNIAPIDLHDAWAELHPQVSDKIEQIVAEHGEHSVKLAAPAEITHIDFPVSQHPEKVKSHNLDKTPHISGQLNGIKGQYLILDNGVINIRKYTGYEIEFTALAKEVAE